MDRRELRLRNVIKQCLEEQPPPSDAEGRCIAIAAGTLLRVAQPRCIEIYEEERNALNGRLLSRAIRDE